MAKEMTLDMDGFVAMTKALSDSHRVRALCALRKGELCVCQIIEILKLAPSTISKHMSILKQAGLVDSRKDGRWVYYRLAGKKNSGLLGDIVKLSVSALEGDGRVCADDIHLARIASVGLETLCRHQRNEDGN